MYVVASEISSTQAQSSSDDEGEGVVTLRGVEASQKRLPASGVAQTAPLLYLWVYANNTSSNVR